MAKLTQDEIKWILSVDSKGANREIAVTSSEINKLAQSNRTMTADMKLAEKQIKQQEKEMARLSKAGQENSEAYRQAKETRDMARHDMDDYTRKIAENNRAIDENKKKIEELEQGMSLNEMTMKQLRQRASDLQKQLNITSKEANPKEYNNLQKELQQVRTRMFDVSNSGKGLVQQFAAMNNPVGQAAKAVLGFGQALKALIANPVGVVIMAVAAAFMAIKTAINSSEEASNRFQKIMAPLKLLMDGLLNVLQKVVGAFLDFTLAIMDWAGKAAEKLPFVGNKMAELNEKSKEAIQLEEDKAALRKREYQSIEDNAKKEAEIADLRFKAKQRDLYSDEQIVEFLDQAIALEGEIAQEKIEQAEIALALLELESSRTENAEDMNRKIAEQRALLSNLEAEEKTRTRRMESERQSTIRRMASEDAAAAKAALDKQISDIDFALKEETRILKQQLADRSISQTEYNRLVEEKMIESLHKKLEISGLEKDNRIEIEQEILDYKIQALELEKQLAQERAEIVSEFEKSVMTDNERELQEIRDRHDERIKVLQEQLEKELITETQFLEYRAIVLEELSKELEEKENVQREAEGARQLAMQNKELERQKMHLMEQHASGVLSKQAYNDALLQLDQEYALRSLEISDLSDEQKIEARKRLLELMIAENERETKLQEDEQKKRVELYSGFSEQIGTMMSGVISGNEDVVKSSLKAILNMALDALEAQITMAIASATAQSFAQADSVATFGASGAARAAVLTALIKGAFAGVKALVNNAMSSKSSTTPDASTPSSGSTGRYVITGREDGGFIDVTRKQDKKRYIAKFDPMRRGFVNRPTVIVGDGPAGKSAEWVASNDALQNPTIIPFIKMLDDAQQAGSIRTIDLNHLMRARMAGFESGGFIDRADPGTSRSTSPQPFVEKPGTDPELMREIRDLLSHLKNNGVKAPIVLSEFERKRELLESSRNIGRK